MAFHILLLGYLATLTLADNVEWQPMYSYHTSSPSPCPVIEGEAFFADPQKRGCCDLPDGVQIVSATGTDGKATFACCEVSSTCTGAVPTPVDWAPITTGSSYAWCMHEAMTDSIQLYHL